ncbi:hypothetical protein Tco_0194601 [Tanacetum coccineum]
MNCYQPPLVHLAVPYLNVVPAVSETLSSGLYPFKKLKVPQRTMPVLLWWTDFLQESSILGISLKRPLSKGTVHHERLPSSLKKSATSSRKETRLYTKPWNGPIPIMTPVGIKGFIRLFGITVALIKVSAAQEESTARVKLVLLVENKENILSSYYCLYTVNAAGV